MSKKKSEIPPPADSMPEPVKSKEPVRIKPSAASISQTEKAVTPKPSPEAPDKVQPSTASMPVKTKAIAMDPVLVLKSGTTDLRRGDRSLTALMEKRTSMKAGPDVILGFANEKSASIKLVHHNSDESVTMTKKHYPQGIPNWPEYKEIDKPGHFVVFKGKEKKAFLDDLGLKSSK
ncbi:MAG: hypothetical protein LBQ88_06020 [Treponema sp.]|jgi:siroheme synthase|nr:hypothetical protein [Treponema sp.]